MIFYALRQRNRQLSKIFVLKHGRRQSSGIDPIKYYSSHGKVDKNARKHHTQESQEVSPFPTGDHKAARNRLYSITETNMKHIKAVMLINTLPYSYKDTKSICHIAIKIQNQFAI